MMISKASAATSVPVTGTLALSSGVIVTADPRRRPEELVSGAMWDTGAGVASLAIPSAASALSSDGVPWEPSQDWVSGCDRDRWVWIVGWLELLSEGGAEQGGPQLACGCGRPPLIRLALKMVHDRAAPIDADLGILGLAVPNAPVQALDLLDDHRFRRAPGRVIRRQAVGEGGQRRVPGSPDSVKVAADQLPNVRASFCDGAEHLPARRRRFAIADPHLQMPLAVCAAADERRVQGHLAHHGREMRLKPVQPRCRPAMQWPARPASIPSHTAQRKRGSRTVTSPNSVATAWSRWSFTRQTPPQHEQSSRRTAWIPACAATISR